jgi:hypothetical protein
MNDKVVDIEVGKKKQRQRFLKIQSNSAYEEEAVPSATYPHTPTTCQTHNYATGLKLLTLALAAFALVMLI